MSSNRFKFRAWDERTKVMHFDFQFIKSGDESNDWILFVSDKQPISNYNGWAQNPYFQQQLKIMQFTGLKDKNGKEVYEGDILEFDRYEWYRSFSRSRADIEAEPAHYFVVRWEQGGWAVSGCISEVGTYCEVVGNIYEHPELLEAP